MPAEPPPERHPVEQQVAAVRTMVQGASDALAAITIPSSAPVFFNDVSEAKHHLSVAKLKLSNALSTRLPGDRR